MAVLKSGGARGPLLERTRELAALESVIAGARRGAGGCAVVEGGAGIGKSRLLAEARTRAGAAGVAIARARCSEIEGDFAYGAALQLFEPLVRPTTDPDLFAGAASLALPLFERAGAVDGRDFSRAHGLHWLAANLAERTPLAIVVDDAHWSDIPTLKFLVYLAQRVDELPLAVIVAARSGEDGSRRKLIRRLAAHPAATRIELEPLGAQAVADLVRAELGSGATDSFCSACFEATGGNPLFVRALTADVRERGGAPDDAAAERVPQLGADRLARAVTARLDAMHDGTRELAEALAVMGDGASHDQVAELAGLDAGDAERGSVALAAAGLADGRDGLAFVHPIVRAAVDDAIDPPRRALLHRRAARMLRGAGADPERIASHVLAAGDGARDAAAAEVLRAAAARASARGAPHAAANYLLAVVAASAAPDAAVLHELALAAVRSHAHDAAERVAAALHVLRDSAERASAAVRLGLAQFDAGAHDAAAATFAAGLEDAPPDGEAARTLRACLAAASGLGHTGGETAAEIGRVVERAHAGLLTRAERLHLGHGAVAAAFAGRSIEETRRLARAALAGDGVDASRASEMSAMVLGTVALLVADELDEAERALDRALAAAREVGSVTGYASAAHIRAWTHYRRGRLADATADAESVLDAARYGWEPALPAAVAVLVLCHLERGDVDAAEAATDIPGGADRWQATFTWNDFLDARGRMLLARGDPVAARADFEAAGATLDAVGADHPSVVGWRSGAVQACVALGDFDAARRLADDDIERARAYGAPRALGMALRTAGTLAGGDRGIGLLREADEVLARSPARLEQAHAQAALGAELLAAGHRVAAREPLSSALDAADKCGATALVEGVRGLLTEAGARPRRRALSGRDSLTPRELRLTRMAMSMTNREIAEALFITTKTVETHLRHAYDKLGISSRRELAAAFGDEDDSNGSGASGASSGPARGSVRSGRNAATSTSGANQTM